MSESPIATENRRRKALAMVAVIDAQFRKQFPRLDDRWYRIASLAGFPRKKVIGEETRKLVREVYEGRAAAPVERRAAS